MPIEKNQLRRKLEDAHRELERLALYDNLTGLGNRNLFQIERARAIAVSQRRGAPFTATYRSTALRKSASLVPNAA